MTTGQILPASSTEPGSLGVMHLKRYWDKSHLKKEGKIAADAFAEEWNMDITLLAVLGLGLEQTIRYLYSVDTDFKTFETWILSSNNEQLDEYKINTFNNYVLSREVAFNAADTDNNLLTDADINFWEKHGYVIIREAISADDCENTINAICDFIDIRKDEPDTWYRSHPSRQGIMVQLFQHPILQKNRLSAKIRFAYEQLWQRKDLWVNTDRVGFNPPETAHWKFPGPGLHWDVSLAQPIPFGLQGILYLSDTKANQGAFTLVPGFQHNIDDWLNNLLPDTNPRTENIHAFGAQPIVANAGDFIIWHHALPHGSSPNITNQPRYVQYINYAPLDAEVNPVWK